MCYNDFKVVFKNASSLQVSKPTLACVLAKPHHSVPTPFGTIRMPFRMTYVNPIRSWAFILSCLHHVGWESPFYGSVSSTRPWGLEEKVPGIIFLSISQDLVQCLAHWESTGCMHVKHRMLKCLNVSMSRLNPEWDHVIVSKLSRLTWFLLFWTSIVLLICFVHLHIYCYMHCLLWHELFYILAYVS